MNRISSSKLDTCNPRITTKYKEGTGDKGVSKAGGKVGLPKISYGPPANQTELIRNQIYKLIYENKLESNSDFSNTLLWFANNTFSLGTFLYLHSTEQYADEHQKHLYPKHFLSYMENKIFDWKGTVGDAKDFIIWTEEPYISIDNLRIMVRELESRYFYWRSDKEHDSIEYVASVLNRLSSFIFWGTREFAYKNGYQELYWGSEVSEFLL